MFYEDRFSKPNLFQADMAVSIDPVIEKKLAAVDALESQFFEGGANGSADLIPSDQAGRTARQKAVREGFSSRFAGSARMFRTKLREIYGAQKGDAVKYAEAFEVSEYGRQPSKEELRKLFPVPVSPE
jgi:hypothetical protein